MKEPLPLASSAVINDTRRGLIKRFAVATIGIKLSRSSRDYLVAGQSRLTSSTA